MTDEEQGAEVLDAYWTTLQEGRDVIPPADLLPELAEITDRLHVALRPPKARDSFKRQLQGRLEAELRQPARGGPSRLGLGLPTIPHRWGRVSLVAMLVLALVGGGVLLTRHSHSASAQEIIRRAHTVAMAPAAAGIRSFELTLQGEIWPGNSGLGGFAGITEAIRIESRYWYQAPNRWRIERRYLSMPSDRVVRDYYHAPDVEVSDGRTYTAYDAGTHTVTQHPLNPGQTGIYDVAPFGIGADDLSNILRDSGRCYSPSLQGQDTVAGRPVYVVDLGPSRCPSNSSHGLDGRRVLWIDRATSLVLKSVLYSVDDSSRPYTTATTVDMKYDVLIPGSTFSFTAPPGRPVTGPTPIPVPPGVSLAELRHLLPFPIFVPTYVPPGLKPSAPQEGAGGVPVVTINYEGSNGVALAVADGPAGCCLASDPRKYGEATPLRGGRTAHLLNNEPQFGGPILWWQQDGTYIAVSGPHLTKDDLVKVAASMSKTATP